MRIKVYNIFVLICLFFSICSDGIRSYFIKMPLQNFSEEAFLCEDIPIFYLASLSLRVQLKKNI